MGLKLNKWLIILNAMLDIGVSRLPPLCFYSGMESEFLEFVSILKNSNVHFKELSLNFQVRIHYFYHFFKKLIFLFSIDVK